MPLNECTQLTELIEDAGLPYGREDSFKLLPARLLEGRTLLGIRTAELNLNKLQNIASTLGMPPLYAPLLAELFPRSNMVFVGVESSPGGTVWKVYLELWEALRQRIRAHPGGAPEPGLLNVGVKWQRSSGMHCRADYLCYPLLSTAGILGRIRQLYRGAPAPTASGMLEQLVRLAAQRRAQASFLYVEVGEDQGERQSFDLNLYKADLRMGDVQSLIDDLGRHFRCPEARLSTLMAPIQAHPLGHVSAGFDRHGREFTTIYHEVKSLPA